MYTMGVGFPCGSAGKDSACNAGDLGSNPRVGKIPLEKGNATHSSILAWRIPLKVHGVRQGVVRSFYC